MNKEKLHFELNRALNISKEQSLKSYSKEMLSKARLLLQSTNALDKSNIYTYRKKGHVPASMIEGAALGVLIEKEYQTKKLAIDYHALSFKKNLEHAGLFFDETKIVTKFNKSKNKKNSLDAHVKVTLKGAHLNTHSEINKYSLRFLSDSKSSKDVFDKIIVAGPGVKLQENSSKTSLQSFQSDGEFSHTQIATEYELHFSPEANQSTEVIISRNLTDSFTTDPNQSQSITERSTFTLRRPTKKLEIEVIFDRDDFSDDKSFSIGLIAFPGYLPSTRSFNTYNKNIFSLDGIDLMSLGKLHWKWTSQIPPITGMKYGFQYNIEEVFKCLI